jgi:hypothetical protein
MTKRVNCFFYRITSNVQANGISFSLFSTISFIFGTLVFKRVNAAAFKIVSSVTKTDFTCWNIFFIFHVLYGSLLELQFRGLMFLLVRLPFYLYDLHQILVCIMWSLKSVIHRSFITWFLNYQLSYLLVDVRALSSNYNFYTLFTILRLFHLSLEWSWPQI